MYVLKDGSGLGVRLRGRKGSWMENVVIAVGKTLEKDVWSMIISVSAEDWDVEEGVVSGEDLSATQMVFEFLRLVSLVGDGREAIIEWLYEHDDYIVDKLTFNRLEGTEAFAVDVASSGGTNRRRIKFWMEDDEIKIRYSL